MSSTSDPQAGKVWVPGGPSGRRPTLQNMSCRPDATVQHQGQHQCRAIRFAFPASEGDATPSLSSLAWAVDPIRRPGVSLIQHLERVAAEPCPLLAKLPSVAAVHLNASGESLPGLTDQPRLVLAVLCRCNGRVFIRDRAPCISEDRLLRSITLLAPCSWNPHA
ncbi:MAG: hypothetical protein EBQ99_06955 [Planctomycetes bacterium]|nr:hypothetical protein [Planctomycetota bacterium]